MSLFNRLDKIRNRGEGKDDEGMFAIPDLGPRPTSNPASPPPSQAPAPTPEPTSERAPVDTQDSTLSPTPAASSPTVSDHRPSPLERLQRRNEEANRGPETSAPTPASPEVTETPAADEGEETEVPWPVTPFRRPALFGTSSSIEENSDEYAEEDETSPDASISKTETAAEGVFASAPLPPSVPDVPGVSEAPIESEPVAEAATSEDLEPAGSGTASFEAAAPSISETAPAEAAEAPTAEAPTRTTAFDRLMAARAKTERPAPGSPAPSPAPAQGEAEPRLYSLAERLAAMHSPEVPEAGTTEAPIAEAPLDPEQSLEAVDSSTSINAGESYPEETEVAEPVAKSTPAPAEAAPELAEELISEPATEPVVPAEATAEETAVPEMSSASSPAAETENEPNFGAYESATGEETSESEVASPLFAAAEATVPESAAPESEPVSPTPLPVAEPTPSAQSNSPLSLRERLALQGSSGETPPLPQTQPNQPPAPTPTTMRPNSLQDRFVARENLDRSSSPATAEAPPVPATPFTPGTPSGTSSAIERPGESLARIDNEGPSSEREIRNRALYRQKHLIFDSVLGSLDPRTLQDPRKESLRPALEKAVDGAAREWNLVLEGSDRTWMVDEFLREINDVGPLVPLLDDPTVNKILVAGANDVAVEKLGRIERTGISFRDDDHLLAVVRRIAEMTGGRLDAKVPLLDRPLPDGARIRAKIPPLAPQPTLTIEKSSGNPLTALKRQQAERGRAESLPYSQLRERIQQRLLREFESNTGAVNNPERLRAQVEEMIAQVIAEERVVVTRAEKAALVMDLLNEIVGLGPLEPLLNDPEVDEIMVNGPFQIYVERKGKLEISGQRFRDNGHVMQVIDRIIAPLGRRVDEKSPMVDGRLRDGSRFNAIIPPLALSGPTMTIRKFARDPFTMTDLINFGSLTREAAQFLQAAVEGRLNIVVSGGTGSGKTTTLNVLSSFIPSSERIVTIEDAAELQLRQEHVIRLETRPPNIEGVGEVGIRDLVRNALRMRPDRIVVGECRGGEALDMLQAMNTGHDGSLTTGHSNGPRDTLKRLETMVMMAGFDLPVKAIREQISMAVQLIVHQERMRDGKRRVTAITELVGMEGDVITMQDLFRFEQERVDDEGRIIGALVPTGLRPKNYDTIIDNGVELTMDIFMPRGMNDGGVRSRLAEHRVGGVR